jgi:serine/threonine protein kinase
MMWDRDDSGGGTPGHRLGPYRFESRLGAGSIGIVYRAINEESGQTVAIKLARDVREAMPQRLLHSGRILNRLDHPNIVRACATGQYRGAAYLVMEFVPGLTLANVLAEHGPLPWPEVVRMGVQLCDALKHMHARGFLHRNLKPAHLILAEDNSLKLIGFGLAIAVDETRFLTDGFAIGTPGYMAPEQICGGREISIASDLYALGVVLWNLLTSESPYQDSNEVDWRRGGAALALMHLTQPPPRPSTRVERIPKALDDLIVQLMDRSPKKRPHDAATVARVLVSC